MKQIRRSELHSSRSTFPKQLSYPSSPKFRTPKTSWKSKSVIFSKYKSRQIKHPDGPESVILLQYESFQVTPTGAKRTSDSLLSIKPFSPNILYQSESIRSGESCLSLYGSAYAGFSNKVRHGLTSAKVITQVIKVNIATKFGIEVNIKVLNYSCRTRDERTQNTCSRTVVF